MKIEITSPSLQTEITHYSKMNRCSVSEAVEKILKIYLRGMKND